MRIGLLVTSLMLTLAPPIAVAQSPSSGMPATGQLPGLEQDAAIGEQPAGVGQGRVLVEIDDVPNLEARNGPARQRLALMQTTLLNRFSQLGYSKVSNFRRDGETYVAEVTSPEGEEQTVIIDPMSGTIVARSD